MRDRSEQADAESINRLVGYICPTTAVWMRDHSRVPEVLRMRADPSVIMTF
ncbi:hypothetical protein AB0B89_15180 [Sphaerisporangium sp. NPDC049002]|uniref:hypothetical protein n=1 Tax=unclassified Sphaerisporangium TaxID=2630420 RepID=UPI0033CD8236